jgi:septum formation protein
VTPVVLASKSASRQAILAAAGVTFEAVGSGVDEDAAKADWLARGQGPREVAAHLAQAKAVAVSKTRPGALVIGADQTLDLDGELFDKAESLEAARARLRRLRGRAHLLHSAVAVASDGVLTWSTLESPRLTMRHFSDVWLDGYLARGGETLLGSVGCYLLEGEGAQLFEIIEGDYFAILGLPLLPLLACLRAAGGLST